MSTILKILSILAIWGVVAGIVLGIEPEIIKDVLLPGLYLPLVVSGLVATSYTSWSITGSMWAAVMSGVMTALMLILLITKVFHPLSGMAIVISTILVNYFAIKKSSTSN